MKEQTAESGIIDKIKKGLPVGPSFNATITKVTTKAKATVLDLVDENNGTIKGIIEGKYEADIGTPIKINHFHVKIVDGNKILMITAHEKIPTAKKVENKEDEKPQQIEETKIPPKPLLPTIASNPDHTIPIKDINSRLIEFIIKGKVIEKYPVKAYKNDRSEGKILKFDVADETSSIEIICFNEMTEKFDHVQKGGIYSIKNGCIMQANKIYTTTKSDFKIKLDKSSEISQCKEDIPIVKQACSFKSVSDITTKDCGLINIIGIVSEVYEAANLTSKTGKSLCKRVLILTDESNKKLEVTLWDKQARDEEFLIHTIVAFKNAVGSIYNQKVTIKITQNTVIIRDPDIERKEELLKYVHTTFANKMEKSGQSNPKSYSNCRISIQNLKIQSESKGDEEDKNYYSIAAEVESISKKKPFYNGCPICQKKVNLEGLKYRCEKCNKCIDTPTAIYFVGIKIFDHTGSIFANIFHEKAMKLFKIPADKIKLLYDANKEAEAIAIMEKIKSAQFNFIISTKRMNLSYNGNEQITYNVVRIEDIDYKAENLLLLQDIQAQLEKQVVSK